MENTEHVNEDIICPFCGEKGFDKIGLKLHIERSRCDDYNNIDISKIKTFF